MNVSLKDWVRKGLFLLNICLCSEMAQAAEKSLKDPIHLGCFSHIVTMKKEIDNLVFHGMLQV